jgi:hypothetical protein
MYTGDDFNYPALIKPATSSGFSHALLGIFDPIAPSASAALAARSSTRGDGAAYDAIFAPTVPLSRHIFRAPTQYYKTGVVFMAWLNGWQDHFVMVGGAQAMRSLPYLVECFKQADACGALAKPDLAVERMQSLLRKCTEPDWTCGTSQQGHLGARPQHRNAGQQSRRLRRRAGRSNA